MNSTFDIVAVGEILVDFVSREAEDGKKLLLEGNPGGAPANVLAAASKLGRSTALIGKVGQDGFGPFLIREIEIAGVDTQGVVTDPKHPTTLAMVTLDATGNRSFGFYRSQTADVMLCPEDLDLELIEKGRIFHFGSVTLAAEPARSATFAAARHAKSKGIPVSYDPNLRPPLWENMKEARQVIAEGMSLADIAKVSDEELFFLAGDGDLEERSLALAAQYGLKLLVVTRGPRGCLCVRGGEVWTAPTFDTPCVDTTGAGDAFWGATLSQLLELAKTPEELSGEEILSLMDFSNAAGSLATTRKGAIPAMPDRAAIQNCVATVPYLELDKRENA